MNLKCGYFAVGGIMCGSLVGIFIGALAVSASLGYMILLLGAWGSVPLHHIAQPYGRCPPRGGGAEPARRGI